MREAKDYMFAKVNKFNGETYLWDELYGYTLKGSIVSGKRMLDFEADEFKYLLKNNKDSTSNAAYVYELRLKEEQKAQVASGPSLAPLFLSQSSLADIY